MDKIILTDENCIELLTDLDFIIAHNKDIETRKKLSIEYIKNWIKKYNNINEN
jgi:hypothetical protein